MNKICMLGVIAMFACACSSPLFAAEKTDKAAKRAAIMMQKLKQDMEVEKAALEQKMVQEKQVMNQQLNSVQAAQRITSTRLQEQLKRHQALQAETDQLKAEKQVLETQLQQLQMQLQQEKQTTAALNQQLTNHSEALKVNDGQRKKLVEKLSVNHQKLQQCVAKNNQLYAYGKSLISLYSDASWYQKVMREEPFFQLKRVELENMLQSQRDLLDADHLEDQP